MTDLPRPPADQPPENTGPSLDKPGSPAGPPPEDVRPPAGPPTGYAVPAHGYGPPPGGPSQREDPTWAVLSYGLCLVAGFVAPLVIYLVKRDQSAYVRHHAAQALNNQLTYLVYSLGVCCVGFTPLIIGAIASGDIQQDEPPVWFFIGLMAIWLVMICAAITHFVFLIIGMVKAGKGELYRMPKILAWPMVK